MFEPGVKYDFSKLDATDWMWLDRGLYARYYRFPFESLEDLFTSERGMGITEATPVQRAICRLLGRVPLGDLARHPDVLTAFNTDDVERIEYIGSPKELMLLAGIRCGKSMLVACAAVWATQTVQVKHLAKHSEIPRYSIVSLEKDNAHATHDHVVGLLKKPDFRHIRFREDEENDWRKQIEETSSDIVGSEFVKHPSGRPIEIRVVAGKRSGGSLISRWSAGYAFEEAPRMVGASEGVVNYDDNRKAVVGRLLDGACGLSVGSPYSPISPLAQRFKLNWGCPNRHLICLKARADKMNPSFWTEERAADLKESDPLTYQTDFLANFADPEETLIPEGILDECTRRTGDLAPCPRNEYVAAIDPATRGNAWTFIIGTAERGKRCVAVARSWQGNPTNPLRAHIVFKEISELMAPFGIDTILTDQWASDPLWDTAERYGLNLTRHDISSKDLVLLYLALSEDAKSGLLELPPDPLLKRDLESLKKCPTMNGMKIKLPLSADKRHCDYAPPVVMALQRWLPQPLPEEPLPGSLEAAEALAEKIEREAEKEFERDKEAEKYE